MSWINGVPIEKWIEKNRPDNGVFKVYWTEDGEGVSLEDMGFGLRYEWEYKDGQRHGVSKGWYRDGKLKNLRIWENGKEHGVRIECHKSGHKQFEGTMNYDGVSPDSYPIGVWKFWDSDGKKIKEWIYKDNGEFDEVLYDR
jgi:antitoxin component YwqK of YwqJK toxin-antitoxin module